MEKTYRINVRNGIAIRKQKHPQEKKLSEIKVAELANTNSQLFSDWRQKKSPDLINLLKRIAEVCDCTINDLIEECDE